MTDVVFARPRFHYPSYTDFWRLVELAGYPIVYLDEIDPSASVCYIFTTPDLQWRAGWPGARARLIYWALDWYVDHDRAPIPGVELWAADAWYAQCIGARYVPVGSDARLCPDGGDVSASLYDVILLATPSPRRELALQAMHHARLFIAPDGWGEMRHRALRASRAMAHVHQHDDAPVAAPQRFALAAAYRLPLFTETLGAPGIFTSSVIFQASLPYLGRLLQMWLHDPQQAPRLRDMADALHDLLCEQRSFRRVVEGAL